MYQLLIKQFFRSKTCQIGILLILVMGFVSILIGKQFLDDHAQVAAQLNNTQKEHIDRMVELHNEDPGLLLYYLKFAFVNEINPLAALSIGQKDLNPDIQHIKILTLKGQKYDANLVNPVRLLYGNFDFSFVLIYMFPLLIIAFTYNLLSEEIENGTWKLVKISAFSRRKYLLLKLSVRMALIIFLMSLICFSSVFILKIPFTTDFLAFYLVGILYLVFWFAISFWMITLKFQSGFNAFALLSIWLFLVILFPSIINNAVTNLYPIPEAFTTMIKQRDGYHQKWDTNKKETLTKFYKSYPQFENYGYPPEEGFNWLWYYAMQHAGDEESQTQSNLMLEKITKRQKLSENISKFFLPMHSLLIFNKLAGTSLDNHIRFLQETDIFHEDTRLYFYPKIFANEDLSKIDWDQFKPQYLKSQQKPINWFTILAPLLLWIILLAMISIPFIK